MKYATLRDFLSAQTAPRISMSFAEVAAAAKVKLPASAFRYPQWWQNDAQHHVQAKAWLEAGYKTENVDLDSKRVEFVRTATPKRGVREMQKTYDHKPNPLYKVHPAYGALKGVVTIDPDWDLTNPAMDPEEYAEYEASLLRKMDEIAKGLRGKK
jgi:hypothetical protein